MQPDAQTILARTPFLLTRCSADLRYVFVSEAYASMIGRRPQDVAGRPIIEIMGERGLATILPYVERVLRGQTVEYEEEVEFQGIGARTLRVIYTPDLDEEGEIQGWIASILDVSDRKRAERRIAADLSAMTLLRDVGAHCVAHSDDFNVCSYRILDAAIALANANKGTFQILDARTGALVIAAHRGFEEPFLDFFAAVRDDVSACGVAMLCGSRIIVEDVEEGLFVGHKSQQVLIDAGVRSVISTPLTSGSGKVLGMVSTHFTQPHHPTTRELHFLDLLARQSADYLHRRQSQETEKLLVQELQHRTSNLLAVVQAIARRSLTGDIPMVEARSKFDMRLRSLASINSQITTPGLAGVSLQQILRRELQAFLDRTNLTGANALLEPEQARSFALLIHELATNAAKHGALSNDRGEVDISCELTHNNSGGTIRFQWGERDGPPLSAIRSNGFGMSLLRAMYPKANVEFAETGLRLTLEIMGRIVASSSSPDLKQGQSPTDPMGHHRPALANPS
ncbi:MAG: PAS domain-containing protein [Xanthobacteraceae bacterium]|nr:PAS domain-containing protein [Xanthobacteraceae bacterium]